MGLLIIIALLVVGHLVLRGRGHLPNGLGVENRKEPIDIVNDRYARGQIDREEHERLKQGRHGA